MKDFLNKENTITNGTMFAMVLGGLLGALVFWTPTLFGYVFGILFAWMMIILENYGQ